jgi:ATP-dependent protease HslVU (ClpYQ) peptidase subunit
MAEPYFSSLKKERAKKRVGESLISGDGKKTLGRSVIVRQQGRPRRQKLDENQAQSSV